MNARRTLIAVSTLILAGFLTGCAETATSSDVDSASTMGSGTAAAPAGTPVSDVTAIAGKSWSLASLSLNGQTIPIPPAARIDFQVRDNGEVTGRAGVNQFYGSMRLKDGTITWDPPCSPPPRWQGPRKSCSSRTSS